MAQSFDYTVLEMIESAARTVKIAPLNLGGTGGVGGGVGGPPGGFVGQLPQYRITYDTTEAATLSTLPSGVAGISGWSLVDNLNHIRYRLNVLESGASITVVDDNTPSTYYDVDTIHFSGAGVTVTDLGGGDLRVAITATGSGGGGTALTVEQSGGSPITNVDTIIFSGATVTNLGSGDVLVTVSGGGGGITQASADARYLKLDASNDPLTSQLDIINANNGDGGIYLQTIGNAYTLDAEQYTVTNNINVPTIFAYRETSGAGNITSAMIDIEQNATGAGTITGDFLLMKTGAFTKFNIDKDGKAYSAGSLLITEAPSDGTFYGRLSGAWVHYRDNLVFAYPAAGDITAAENTHYDIVMAGMSADANFILPATSVVGQKIRLTVSSGDATYKLIIKGAASVTINNGSAATEWSRVFTTGETLEFVSVNTNAWHVCLDGRIANSGQDGWIPNFAAWSYSSADSPTFVISIAADVTGFIGVGDRLKIKQTTVKYFIVTAVGAYSGGNTLVTVYGGTDYTLANAAISQTYFSHVKHPFGFPTNPDKWTVSLTDTSNASQATPTNNTYYNVGTLSISIPIGNWRVFYNWTANLVVTTTAVRNLGLVSALSTSNNSVSDNELRMSQQITGPTGANNVILIAAREKNLLIAAKTTYYLIVLGSVATDAQTSIAIRGDLNTTVVKCVCGYL
jgi:hypothetical protein